MSVRANAIRRPLGDRAGAARGTGGAVRVSRHATPATQHVRRQPHMNEVEMLMPVLHEVLDRTGLKTADIDFTCSGSSDYLAGRAFSQAVYGARHRASESILQVLIADGVVPQSSCSFSPITPANTDPAVMPNLAPANSAAGVNFGMLLNLASVAHTDSKDVLWQYLRRYVPGATPEKPSAPGCPAINPATRVPRPSQSVRPSPPTST